MKIAIVTDDEQTISQHFGQAQYYKVFTVEKGIVVKQEIREKVMHHHGNESHDCHTEHGCHTEKHGTDTASQDKHAGILANIKDCDVVIAGGMGWGAFESLKSIKIEPIITDVEYIDDAVNYYLEGILVNLMEKLH